MYFIRKNSAFTVFLALLTCFIVSRGWAQTVPEIQQKMECPVPRTDVAWPIEWKGSSFLQAVRHLDIEKAEALLKTGVNIRETDNRGTPPLLLTLRLLLAGEPPGGKMPYGMSRQQIRKESKAQVRMLKLLLDYHADPNQKAVGDVVPLHNAVEQVIFPIQTSKQIISMLLRKGADVDAQDDHGTTALMLAARSKRTEIVRFLLKHKANPDLMDCHGDTALSMAKKKGNDEIARLLELK